eukprot:gene8174-8258_t
MPSEINANNEPHHGVHASLFQQRLNPHRSLNRRQFRVLMVVFALLTSSITIPFFMIGAWPVIGFLGLDILLVYLAFRASFRSARAYEEISLNVLELHVARVSARGERRDWRFNPRWVRLNVEEDEDFGILRLSLQFSGQSLEIGRFLAPIERENFVKSFRNALYKAQRGPQFSEVL